MSCSVGSTAMTNGQQADDWTLRKLADVAEVVGGGTPSTKNTANFGGDVAWVTPKDLAAHKSRHISHGERSLSQMGLSASSAKLLPTGSVLVSSRAPIGLTAITTAPVATNQGCRSLVPDNKLVDTEFLYYLMSGSTAYLHQHANGTTFQELPGGVMKQLEFLFPRLEEQRRIAGVLGALDAKIESCARIAKKCHQQIISAYEVSMEQSVDDGDTVPRALGTVVDMVGGGTPSTKEGKYWTPAEHLWATPRDLSQLSVPALIDTDRSLSSDGLKKVSSGLLPSRSLLMSSRAPVGYLALTDEKVAINQGFIAIKPTAEKLSPVFMLGWCTANMEEIQMRAGGSTFQEISKKSFGTMTVDVPSAASLDQLERRCTPSVDVMMQMVREIRALSSLRDFLLPRLLSGELRVAAAEDMAGAAS